MLVVNLIVLLIVTVCSITFVQIEELEEQDLVRNCYFLTKYVWIKQIWD